MRHNHHIIPRHLGGGDEPSNLFECSVEEHAELHLALYLEHGHWEDWIACQMLGGMNDDTEWARLEASNTPKNRERKSEKMKERWQNPVERQMRMDVYTPEHREQVRQTTIETQKKMREEGIRIGRKPKAVLFEGVLYHDIKEMSSALGIHLQTCYKKIYSGEAQYQ